MLAGDRRRVATTSFSWDAAGIWRSCADRAHRQERARGPRLVPDVTAHTGWPVRARRSGLPDHIMSTSPQAMRTFPVASRPSMPRDLDAGRPFALESLACAPWSPLVSAPAVTASSTVLLQRACAARRFCFACTGTTRALRHVTQFAALEFAAMHRPVIAVQPGQIDSDIPKVPDVAENQRPVPRIPMQRIGATEEMAKLVVFLPRDDSSCVTRPEVVIVGAVTL